MPLWKLRYDSPVSLARQLARLIGVAWTAYEFAPVARLALLALSACAIGPDYQRPQLDTPAPFKQVEGWKPAAPAMPWRAAPGGSCTATPAQRAGRSTSNVSNQNLAAVEAQYRQAQALVRGSRAAFFPSLSAGAGKTRCGPRAAEQRNRAPGTPGDQRRQSRRNLYQTPTWG